MNENRIDWVDTAKALGLFLVFWGHLLYHGTAVAGVMNKAIYSFHMPMYFILSGYVIKADSTISFDYFKNKFKRILLPAIVLYISTLPIFFYFLDSSMSVKAILYRVFYITGNCAYNDPIWFFFCLFQVLIVAKILRLPESNGKMLAVVLLTSLVLSIACYVLDWKYFNIFGLNKCLLGLFFLSFGIFLRRTNYEKTIKIIGIIALPIWIISGCILNTKVSMYGMDLGCIWLFVVSGIAGALVFFALCKLFEEIEFIRRYAKWTIFIVCSHYVLVSMFNVVSHKLSIDGTYIFDIASFVFVLVALWLYKPICGLVEKKLPILLGR